ncbi:hypothetical protein AMTR_s00003p00199040 [Amborella trichopoda]|uniref:NAD(P)-binding domain-containing protein n=1 Tax=Amborella trichopoda TaxID=13333 RepID=W1P0B0_AMBTC|nr:hypothetical protein AMTR_s00003p00199040 [Amborella trichopoda]
MGTAKYLEKKNHPYDEESPRATYNHYFYHALEDMVAAKLLETQVSWSIHRPRLLMGCSTSSFFNIFGCLSCFVGVESAGRSPTSMPQKLSSWSGNRSGQQSMVEMPLRGMH